MPPARGWPQAIGAPGGLSLAWYWTHQLLRSMGALTVAVALPWPALSAVIVASGNRIGPEHAPLWMWPACAEPGAMPLSVTVTAVFVPVCVSVARPVTPELFTAARSAVAVVAPWPATAGAAGVVGAAAPVVAAPAAACALAAAGGAAVPVVAAPVVAAPAVVGAAVLSAITCTMTRPRISGWIVHT